MRSATPGGATLQNLLRSLSQKLESCSRLPVLEYEAHEEGYTECAAMFSRLAEVERRSFEDLLACLRDHLEEARGPLGAFTRNGRDEESHP